MRTQSSDLGQGSWEQGPWEHGPCEAVEVFAPARLHLGFLDLNGGLGRRFGSLGLAIDGLRTRVKVMRGPEAVGRQALPGRPRRVLSAFTARPLSAPRP